MSELDWTKPLPEEIDVNMFEIFNKGLDSHIKTGKYIIGASGIANGIRRNVIRNLHGLEEPKNNKMLMGNMGEGIVDDIRILKLLLQVMQRKLNLPYPTKLTYEQVINEESYRTPFPNEFPNYEIRKHPDIFTEFYTIELKQTALPKFKWTKEMAPRHVSQENFYIFEYERMGFLYQLNWNFISSKISQGPEYWEKMHRDYEYFKQVKPDRELYDLCLSRLKFMFEYIDTKEFYVPCPSNLFECTDCICVKHCENPITKDYINITEKCTYCGEPIKLTKKASGEYSALPLKRNGVYYHGNDQKDPEKWKDCRQACIDAWEYDEPKNKKEV